jgi:phosphate transport system substrate-binding protein
VLLIVLALTVGACAPRGEGSGTRPDDVVAPAGARDRATLVGAGSTFAAPLVQEWVRLYRRVAPDVDIDYRGGGSRRGVEQLISGAVEFAVSELILADVGAGAGGRAPGVIEIPSAAGGVAIAYNLPGVSSLRLSAGTLAAVLTGKVTRWDDPSIREDNDGAALPATEIRVVHRSDPSGTTQVLTQYLRVAAPDVWTLEAGPTVSWPTGTPTDGSEALMAAVERTAGAIGYASAGHTDREAVGTALLENGVGRFVAPTPENVHAAVSRVNPEAPDAYPISTVSFLLFAPEGPDAAEAAALRRFATWALTEGQRSTERLGYARVPRASLFAALSTVLAGGQRGESPGTTAPGG